jgi:C1A family cysteine protease
MNLMKKDKSYLVLGSAALMLLACGISVAGQDAPVNLQAEIAGVNAAIKKSNGRWVAGVTSLSRLSHQDRIRRVGTRMAPPKAPPLSEDAYAATSVPASLDWRSQDGNYVTPIRDQGQCGSCWAFAMTGGLESYVLLQQHTPGKDVALSEQILVSCDKDDGDDGCNGGDLNGDFLVQNGLPAASAFPYSSTDGDSGTCPASWDQKANLYKIGSWGSVKDNVKAIKTALAKYGPLPTTFMVYEDFMHYKSGIYTFSGQGKELGGHAVVIVGYNDAERYFIVKNSWGTGWGENGYFRIDYSAMKKPVEFGQSTIAYSSSEGGSKHRFAATRHAPVKLDEELQQKRADVLIKN